MTIVTRLGRIVQVAFPVVMGLAMAILINHAAKIAKERDALKDWQHRTVVTISGALGATDGHGHAINLDPDDIGVEVVKAANDRAALRATIAHQNDAIKALSVQSAHDRAISTQAVADKQTVVIERNRWIAKAQAASTSTDWGTCEQELRKAEDALDDLYHAGM